MANPLTPDELVRLAEYCGKEVEQHPNLPHLVQRGGAGVWQPHLDANQWHEIVAKLFADGWEVVESTCPGEGLLRECEMNHMDLATRMPDRQSQLEQADMPCLAGCRAALKVIGGTNAD